MFKTWKWMKGLYLIPEEIEERFSNRRTPERYISGHGFDSRRIPHVSPDLKFTLNGN
jgi:hypothetical protein